MNIERNSTALCDNRYAECSANCRGRRERAVVPFPKRSLLKSSFILIRTVVKICVIGHISKAKAKVDTPVAPYQHDIYVARIQKLGAIDLPVTDTCLCVEHGLYQLQDGRVMTF
jgi:hypothetical protein